jgi:hypothetical protein
MEIEVLRDLVIIISGFVVIVVGIFLAVISYSIYSKINNVVKSAKSSAARIEALATLTTEEIGKPVIQAAGFIQGIACVIGKIHKTSKKGG